MCGLKTTLGSKLTASGFCFCSVIVLCGLKLQHAFLYKVEDEVGSCLLISNSDWCWCH